MQTNSFLFTSHSSHLRGDVSSCLTCASLLGTLADVLSFSEARAQSLVNHKAEQFLSFNQRQLSRIYPSAYRIDSSNFNPQFYWNVGCQLGETTVTRARRQGALCILSNNLPVPTKMPCTHTVKTNHICHQANVILSVAKFNQRHEFCYWRRNSCLWFENAQDPVVIGMCCLLTQSQVDSCKQHKGNSWQLLLLLFFQF